MLNPLAKGQFSTPADHHLCREMLADGSKSFHAASRLLPGRVRLPATIFYAFCRLADDGVDHASDAGAALARLRTRLDLAYAGTPLDQPVDRSFADLIRVYDLPRAPMEYLFDGFAWDATGREYETLSDVRAYGVRVAGSVGVIMALLMGCRDRFALARACELGIAMQLTNIARDVGEDANAARLYLPRVWMREAGLDPDAWLARPQMSDGLSYVVARLLAEAERLYRRSEAGIASLPADCRPAIYAARYIYAEIGHKLAANGYNSIAIRTVVGAWRKLVLMGRSLIAAPFSKAGITAEPLGEVVPLLDEIVLPKPLIGARPPEQPRVEWVISFLSGVRFDQNQKGSRGS